MISQISIFCWLIFYMGEGFFHLAVARDIISRGPGKYPADSLLKNELWHTIGGLWMASTHAIVFGAVWGGYGLIPAVGVSLWCIATRQLLHDGIVNVGLGYPLLRVSDKSTSWYDKKMLNLPQWAQMLFKFGPLVLAGGFEYFF